MKKLKVYLDTSVINFLYADDAPYFQQVTMDFFANHKKNKTHNLYVSEVVVEEILKTADIEKQEKLMKVIEDYALEFENPDEESERLAIIYLNEGLVPPKKRDDARHIGIATVKNFDILLSWNFKHLANVNKKHKIKLINEVEGYYYPLDLVTPLQLMEDENSK